MSHVGKPVPVDTPKQIAILRSTTGLMSAYYMLLTVIIQWCERNGLDEPSARAYITEFTGALSRKADVYKRQESKFSTSPVSHCASS